MDKLVSFFAKKIQKHADLRYGREIISEFVRKIQVDRSEVKVLDLGAGSGIDLVNAKKQLEKKCKCIKMFGVETYEPNCMNLRKKGIEVIKLDIEKGVLPFEDGELDIVIANQIIEHTKEIFWIFSEISRVLKPNGVCIIGIPNLASFHNRIMLFLGMQPPCIDVVGPHVRGFTYQGFRSFIELDNFFKIEKYKASNFYPFPPQISNVLCKLFPKSGVALFFYVRRTAKQGKYIEVLKDRFFETPYYRGETGEIL